MLPQLAILISFFLIAYFFWADNKGGGGSSQALWIPLIWMFLGGSRFPSQWLDLGAPLSPMASLEGSPTDSAVFLALILGGVATLIRRPINWGGLFRKNIWIWLYFLLGAFSILWSDYPFVTLKRLIKALGNVVMVLIILTDQRPYEAIGVILRRFTFLLIPLSFVFIKYYPDLGRAYHMGVAMFTGVTTHKNSLGQICLISGIYFSWSLLLNLRKRTDSVRIHYFTFIVMLFMITWLLYLANSATSNACLVVAACILVIGRQTTMARQPNRILYLTVFSIFLFGLLQVLVNISETLIVMLGRRPDLTTRIPMWEDLIAMVSLYRPGPLQYIPEFIDRKYGRKKVEYPHPSLESILKPTYGIAVYQEQIMQLVQAFAGFSLGEADILRRAIGKKKYELLMEQRGKFIDAAQTQGHPEKLAIYIFDEIIEPFAGYGFNKSHAACYSMIAYQTAYMKTYYPTESMTALMISDAEDTDRIRLEIEEARAK